MTTDRLLAIIATLREATDQGLADDYAHGYANGRLDTLSVLERSIVMEEAFAPFLSVPEEAGAGSRYDAVPASSRPLSTSDRAAIASEAGERAEAQYAELDRLDGPGMSQKLVILRNDLLVFAPDRDVTEHERQDMRRIGRKFGIRIIGISGPIEVSDLRDETIVVDRIEAIADELFA